MDITPGLRRMAIREVANDPGQSLDLIADKLGVSHADLRTWVKTTDVQFWVGPFERHMGFIVDRFLARIYVPTVPVAAAKKRGRPLGSKNVTHMGRKPRDPNALRKCYRCQELFLPSEMKPNGYCVQCSRDYNRERYLRLKAVSA